MIRDFFEKIKHVCDYKFDWNEHDSKFYLNGSFLDNNNTEDVLLEDPLSLDGVAKKNMNSKFRRLCKGELTKSDTCLIKSLLSLRKFRYSLS